MNAIRYLLIIFLLFFSVQALALFMPGGGIQVDTDTAAASDSEGC